MDEPTSKQIGTINCLLCGGTQIYPGPKYQNHLIQEHGVVFDVESLIKISIHKRDHNELFPTTKTVAIGTDDCNLKLEIKKETLEVKKETLQVKKEIFAIKKDTLEEIEVQRGIAIMDKIKVKNKMAKKRGLELLEKVDARIKNEIQSFNVNIKDDEDLEIRMMIDFLDVCFKNEIQKFKYDVLVELEKEAPMNRNSTSGGSVTCYNCNEAGHMSSKCPNPTRTRESRQNDDLRKACQIKNTDLEGMVTKATKDYIFILAQEHFKPGNKKLFGPEPCVLKYKVDDYIKVSSEENLFIQ